MTTEKTSNQLRCLYQQNEEYPLIKIHKPAKNATFDSTLRDTIIVFMMEGNACFNMGNHRDREAVKGDFLLIPAGWTIHYKTGADCIVVVIRLLEKVSFYECHMNEKMGIDGKFTCSEIDPNGAPNMHQELQLQEPQFYSYMPKINIAVWHYLLGLYSSITDGIKCPNYFDIKIKELLYLLRTYYTKEQLHELFHPVASPDTLFLDYVRANYHKYKTVAQLSASMHLSHSGFARKFVKIFNQSPYQWMMDRKSDTIYSELISGSKTIKQIAADYGFISPAQFNDFCKTKLGKTPGELRKKGVSE